MLLGLVPPSLLANFESSVKIIDPRNIELIDNYKNAVTSAKIWRDEINPMLAA